MFLLNRAPKTLRPLLLASPAALIGHGLPEGGEVRAGDARISRSGDGLLIEQRSSRTVIDWDSFGIGTGETVEFAQPDAGSWALNRDTSGRSSGLLGDLSSNGGVFILNPHGILVGSGARLDVGSLVLTSAELEDVEGWMSGETVRLGHTGAGPVGAGVLNQGEIRTSEGGFAALIGRRVENSGRIVASGGRVELHSVESYYLDFTGDGLLNFEVGTRHTGQVWQSGTGSIEAEQVVLQARSASGVLDTVINMDGVVRAVTLGGHGGRITLSGGGNVDTYVSGELDASGEGDGSRGGSVDVFSGRIQLAGGARVVASGDVSAGSVRIGGDFQGGRDAMPAGEVNAWAVDVHPGAVIENERHSPELLDLSLSSGQEARGSVVLWADGGTRFSGSVTTGPQGFVEVSGKRQLIYAPEARVDSPSLLLDPSTIVLTDGDQKGWLLSESHELSANWSFAPQSEAYSQLHVHGRAEGELARPDYAMTLGLPIFESAAASGMQLALRADVISVTGAIRLNQGAAGAISTLTLSADGSIVFAPNATLMGGRMGLRHLSLDAAADITLGSGALIQTSLADVHRTGSDAVEREIPAGLIWISVGARAVFDHATVEAGHLSIAADQVAMSGGALRAWGSAGILTGDSGRTGSIRPAHLWMSARSIDVTGGGADIGDALLVGENFRYILGGRDDPVGSSEFLLGSVQLMAAEGIALRRGAASGRISLSGGGAVSLSSGEALDAQGLLLTAGGLDLNAGGALNIELHSLHASGSASLSGGGSIGLTGSAGVSLLASAGWGISADGDIFFTQTGASEGDLSGLTLEAGGAIDISAGGSAHLGVLSAGVADASLGSGAHRIVQMAAGRAGEIDNRLRHVSVTAVNVLEMAGAGAPSSVVLGAATVHFSGGRLSAGVRFLLSGATLVRSSATVESSGEISIQAHTVQLSAPLMAESVAVSGTSLMLGNMTAWFRDVQVRGTSLSLSGTVSAMRNLILRAEESVDVASGVSLLADQDVQISAGSAVQLGASVVLSAFGDVSLSASGTLVLGESISLDSGNRISAGGASSGALIGSAAVLLGKEFDWSGAGVVSVQSGVTLSASDYITVLAEGGIWLDSSVFISAANAMTLENSQRGSVRAGDAAQLLVGSGGLLLRNRSGPIELSGSVSLSAQGELQLASDSDSIALGDATLSGDSILLSAGAIRTGGELSLLGRTLVQIAGSVTATGTVRIDSPHTVHLSGEVGAAAVRISASSATVQKLIATGQDISLTGATVEIQTGGLSAAGRIHLRAEGPLNVSLDAMSAGSGMTLSSGGSIALIGRSAVQIDVDLLVRAGGDIRRVVPGSAGGERGRLSVAGSAHFSAGGEVALPGLSVSGKLTVEAARITVQDMIGGDVMLLSAPSITLAQGGARAQAGADLSLDFTELVGAVAGTLSSARGAVALRGRPISYGSDLTIHAATSITFDARRAGGTNPVSALISVSGSADFSAGGQVSLDRLSASGDLTVRGGSIDIRRVESGASVQLQADFITLKHVLSDDDISLSFSQLFGSLKATLSSTQGSIVFLGDTLSLRSSLTAHAGADISHSGLMHADSVVEFRAGVSIDLATLSVDDRLLAVAGSLLHLDTVSGAGVMGLAAPEISLSAALADSHLDVSFSTLRGAGEITLSSRRRLSIEGSGRISAVGTLHLLARRNLDISADILEVDSALTVSTGRALRAGNISTGGNLSLRGRDIHAMHLDIGGWGKLSADGLISVSSGGIVAAGALSLEAISLSHSGALTHTLGEINIYRSISAGGSLWMHAHEMRLSDTVVAAEIAMSGNTIYASTISSDANLSLRGQSIQAVSLDAGGWGKVSVERLLTIFPGGIRTGDSLSLDAPISYSLVLISTSTSTSILTVGGEINIQGSISAGGSLWMQAHEMRLSDTVVAAEIAMSGNTIYAGTISSDANLSLRGQSIQAVSLDAGGWGKVSVERLLTIFPGGIRTGDSLSLDAPISYSLVSISTSTSTSILTVGGEINIQGSISAGGSLWVYAHDMRLSDTVKAAAITISGNTVFLWKKSIAETGDYSFHVQISGTQVGGPVAGEDISIFSEGRHGLNGGGTATQDFYLGTPGSIDVDRRVLGAFTVGRNMTIHSIEADIKLEDNRNRPISLTGTLRLIAGGAVRTTLDASDSATLASATVLINGPLSINAGTSIQMDALLVQGALNAESDGTVQFGYLSGGASVSLSAGESISAGSLTVAGDAQLTAVSEITLGDAASVGGSALLRAGQSIQMRADFSAGAFTVSAGAYITAAGSVSASGQIEMTAPRIQMAGNAAGGAVSISASSLTVQQVLASGGDVSLIGQDTLSWSGGVSARGDIYVLGGGALDISYGTISAGGSMTLSAPGESVALIGAADAPLRLGGDLTVHASGDLIRIVRPQTGTSDPGTTLSSGGSVQISAGGSVNLGTLLAGGGIHISASETIDLRGISSGGGVSISSGEGVGIAGSVSAAGVIHISGMHISMGRPALGAAITLSGSTLDVRRLSAASGDISLIGRDQFTQAGGLHAHRNIDIRVGTALDISYDQISAGGSIFLSAGGGSIAFIGARSDRLTFQGDLTALASGDVLRRILDLDANPTGPDTTLTANGRVSISAGGDIRLGVVQVQSTLHLQAADVIDLKNVSAGAEADVSAGRSVRISGAASISRAVRISASVLRFDEPLTAGSISIRGQTLTARRLSASSGDLSVVARAGFTQAGGLYAHRNIDIRVGTALDISYDQISAGGSIFLSAGGGSIAFIGARSDRLTFHGDLTALASGDVLRRISDLDTNPTGPDTTLTAQGRVSISAGGDIRLGVLRVQSTLHLQAADVIDLKNISAGAEADVSAGGSVHISGSASISRAVRLSASVLMFDEPLIAGSISIRGQTLTAQLLSAFSGDLSVIARAGFTQAGGLYAHRNIDIRVGTALDISYDQISAGGSIFLSAGGGSIAFIGARSDRLTFHGDLTALASGDVLRRILDTNPTGPDTTLTAQGRVSISAGGDIRLGVLRVQDTLHLQAADVIDLKNISAGAEADVSAGRSVRISGAASISRAVRISASVLQFDEPLIAGSISIQGQTLTAQLLSAFSGDLSVVARAAFTQAGGLYAHRNIDIRVGTALDISYDRISAGGSIFLSAGGGSIAFIGARSDRMTFHGDLTALASGDVLRRISDLDANPTGPDTTLTARGRVSISAGGDIRLGVLRVRSNLHLRAEGAIDLKGVSADTQADVSAGGSVHISGAARISRAVRISAPVLRLDESLIAGSISIRGQTLTAQLLSASSEDISVVAGGAFTQAGGLYAHRNIDIRVGAALDISHDRISAGGSIFLSAGGGSIAFIGPRSRHLTFQSDLTALASGDVVHRISDLDINPTGPDTTLSAQGRVSISAGGDIRLGVLRVRSELQLRARDAIDLKGVSADAQADVSAGGSAHISGAVGVSRAVRISASVLRMDAPLIAGSISIRGVTVIAQRLSAFSGDLSVDSGVALSQSGGMHARRDVYVHSSRGLTVSFAEITAGSNLTLSSTRRDIVLFGPAHASLLVGGDTTVRAAGDVLRRVPQPAPGQVRQDTTLSSGGRMGISAGGSVHLGVLQARRAVQILAGEISLRGVSSGAEISLSVTAALSVPRLSAAGTLVWLQAAAGNISVQQVDAPSGLVSVQGLGFTAGGIAGDRMTLNLDRFAGRFVIASSRIDGAVSLHGRSGLMRHAGTLNLAGVLLDALSLSSDAVRQIPGISAAATISLLRFSGGDLMLNSHSENWLRTVRASIVLGDIGIHSGIDLTLHSDAALEGGLVSASAGGNLAFDAAGAVRNSRQTVRLRELIAEGDLVIGGVDDPQVQALEYGGGSITLTRNRALPGRLMGSIDRTWTRRVGDPATGWFDVAVGGVVSAGGAVSIDVQGGVSLGDIRAGGQAVIRTGRTLADGSVQGIGSHGGVLAGHIQAETLILGVRQWGATVEHLNISQSLELDAARARLHGTIAGVFGENAQHYATIPSPKYIGPYQLNGVHIFGHRQRGLDRTDLAGLEQGRVRLISLYFNEGLRFSEYRQNVLRHQGQTGRTLHLPNEESRALWRVHKIWVEPQLARELNLKGEMFLVNPRLPERSDRLREHFEDQDGPGYSP